MEEKLNLNIKVTLVEYTKASPKIIASASKMSTSRKKVEDLLEINKEEIDTWIKETFKRNHFSPWEHSSYTFMIEGCSRVCSHQLVRHRIASFTQQSMRYTEASLREMALYMASKLKMDCPNKPKKGDRDAYKCYSKALKDSINALEPDELIKVANVAYVFPPLMKKDRALIYANSLIDATANYYQLLSTGLSKEDARFIIPMSVRTKITVTMNARELIQTFFPLRMCTRAQWEIRKVAWLLWVELMKIHPELFKYAGPSCVHLENINRDEPDTLQNFIDGKSLFTINRCPELVKNSGIRPCLLNAYNTLNL
ncbi:thymidylate synthase, flavin-dependent [Caldisphaera lagunensis DSM 15908]|uniref:Flavin-dependent thymidylate synthase n=1 Tax=Caldisphaera lagunensis (strain DSM 15908 / JCM 11604 / ANMR 0165 / IC-154) TaxID=1056495 RepID=L0A9T0_CALLD|nr:FAD-dependent thymidylate synthase [Caldisphaera lagunensis]AFZ70174.1 thymidylate synthase, flavin-dependent [Caldisphaera lagunensis DSM 15908]